MPGSRDTSSSSGEHCPQQVPEKVNAEKVIPYAIQDVRFNTESEIDLKNRTEKDSFLLKKNENECRINLFNPYYIHIYKVVKILNFYFVFS